MFQHRRPRRKFIKGGGQPTPPAPDDVPEPPPEVDATALLAGEGTFGLAGDLAVTTVADVPHDGQADMASTFTVTVAGTLTVVVTSSNAVDIVGAEAMGEAGLLQVASLGEVTLTSVTATGSPGALVANTLPLLLGVEAAGHAGLLQAEVEPDAEMLGVEAAGHAGLVQAEVASALEMIGVAGTGDAGLLVIDAAGETVLAAVSAAVAMGTVGTVGAIGDATTMLPTVAATGTVGAIAGTGGTIFLLPSVSATGAPGEVVGDSATLQLLPSTSSAGAVGTTVATGSGVIPMPGTVATGAVGIVTGDGGVPATGDLTASLAGLAGGPFLFQEQGAVNGGAFTSPWGNFIQDHWIAKNPSLPRVVVHFCRDRVTGRLEVWIHQGTLFSHSAMDLPAYTCTIKAGAATLAVVSVPYHEHQSWWRWMETGPRPIVRTPAQLITDGLLPPFATSMGGNVTHGQSENRVPMPIAPMGDGGLARGMQAAGERNDIGIFTGEEARYIFVGDNLTYVFANAEGMAGIPIHWIHETTDRPFYIYDVPEITGHPNDSSSPFYTKGNFGLHWDVDTNHMPQPLLLPGLMTGDPFYTILAQGMAAYWWNGYNRWQGQSTMNSTTGPNYEDEVRGQAWRARDWLVSWLLTPTGAPGWLQSRAQVSNIMTGYIAALTRRWITNPVGKQATFHTTVENAGTHGAWQDSFFQSVLGYWKYVNAPTAGAVTAIYNWKADYLIAMASARDGYRRQNCFPYALYGAQFDVSTNWGQVWAAAGWPEPSGPNLQTEGAPGSQPAWPYVSMGASALEFHAFNGLADAETARDYVRPQLAASPDWYAKWAWRFGPGGPPPPPEFLTGAEILTLVSNQIILQSGQGNPGADNILHRANGTTAECDSIGGGQFEIAAEPEGTWSVVGDLMSANYEDGTLPAANVRLNGSIIEWVVAGSVVQSGTIVGDGGDIV